jgi:hypothetical protein
LEKGLVTSDQLSSVSQFLNPIEMTARGVGAAVALSATYLSLNVAKNSVKCIMEKYPKKVESKGNVQKEKVSSVSRFRNLEERFNAIKQDVKTKNKLKP